jgi:hypothetical protein
MSRAPTIPESRPVPLPETWSRLAALAWVRVQVKAHRYWGVLRSAMLG